MKKFLAFACLLLTATILLCACSSGASGGDASGSELFSEPDTEVSEGLGAAQRVSDYTVIYPKNYSEFAKGSVNTLTTRIKASTGEDLSTERDSRNAEDNDGVKEIIVGRADRQETKDFMSRLDYNEYGTLVTDDKIVITGWTDYTCRLAVEDFKNRIAENTVKGEDGAYYFDFKDNKEFVTVYNDYYGDLPPFEGVVDAVYDSSEKHYMLWYSDVEASAFDTYSATVEGDGYELVNSNTIGNNAYATYVKGERKIHFYYVAAEKQLRIVYGPNDIVPELFATEHEKVATPQATLMPLKYISASGGGACMIYTLEDGTFFVLDGGWKEEADVLYKTLKALNTDANGADAPIVISAWFLSHGHGDHVGCIKTFAPQYGDEVKVNALIFNGVRETQLLNTKVTSDPLATGAVSSGVAAHFKTVDGDRTPIMMLHSGQKLSFGGAVLEVMFTHEDMFDIKITNFNNFNTVVRMTLGGESMLLANDAVNVELPEMIKELGEEALRHEFCMVTHHGADSGYLPYYEVVGAKYYFWPNSYDHYLSALEKYKPWAPDVKDNATEFYLAWEVCTTLNLPYTEGSYIEWNYETERPSQK